MFRNVSVEGAPDFMAVFSSLNKNSKLYKEVDYVLDLLKQNPSLGDKIRRNLWPRQYIQKYGILNLFRVALNTGWRLIYTVSANRNETIVTILEIFDHKEYEQRFGY